MLIQFEQKPWKLVVVGEQEGPTEGRSEGYTKLGGKGKQRKAAVTATGLLLLQLEARTWERTLPTDTSFLFLWFWRSKFPRKQTRMTLLGLPRVV